MNPMFNFSIHKLANSPVSSSASSSAFPSSPINKTATVLKQLADKFKLEQVLMSKPRKQPKNQIKSSTSSSSSSDSSDNSSDSSDTDKKSNSSDSSSESSSDSNSESESSSSSDDSIGDVFTFLDSKSNSLNRQTEKHGGPTRLYAYQSILVEKVEDTIANETATRIIIQLPTGGGKTIIAAELALRLINKDYSHTHVVICVQSLEIVNQFKSSFFRRDKRLTETSFNLFTSSGISGDPRNKITFLMPLFFYGHMNEFFVKFPFLKSKNIILMYDEVHHALANTSSKLIEFFDQASLRKDDDLIVVGLTATPIRHDQQVMGVIFERIFSGPSVGWLIERGFLAKPEYLVARKQLEQTAVKSSLVPRLGELISLVQPVFKIKKLILNLGTLALVEAALTSLNKTATVSARKMTSENVVERAPVLSWFSAPLESNVTIKVLLTVGVGTEGVDIPSADSLIFTGPVTHNKYKQLIGRVLRKKDGENKCLVIDFGGNFSKHGPVWENITFALDGTMSRKASTTDKKKKKSKTQDDKSSSSSSDSDDEPERTKKQDHHHKHNNKEAAAAADFKKKPSSFEEFSHKFKKKFPKSKALDSFLKALRKNLDNSDTTGQFTRILNDSVSKQ